MAISKRKTFISKTLAAGELRGILRNLVAKFATNTDLTQIEISERLADGSRHTRSKVSFADLEPLCSFGDGFRLKFSFYSDKQEYFMIIIEKRIDDGKMDVWASVENGQDLTDILDDVTRGLAAPETPSEQGIDQSSPSQQSRVSRRMAIIKRSTGHTEWISGLELYLDDIKLLERVMSTYGHQVEVYNQIYEFGSVDALSQLGASSVKDITLRIQDPHVNLWVTGSTARLERNDGSEKAQDVFERVRTLLLERRTPWLRFGWHVFSIIMIALTCIFMYLALSQLSLFWFLLGGVLACSLVVTFASHSRRSNTAVHLVPRSVRESVIKVYVLPIAVPVISGLVLALAKQYFGLK